MQDLINNLLASPEFATLIITVLGGILTAVIGVVGKAARDVLKNNLTAAQLKTLLEVARQAVLVAEQTGIAKSAEEKKAEAMRVASAFLVAYGINVSEEQLSAAIEAAVFAELSQWEGFPEAVPSEPAVDEQVEEPK